MHRRKGNQVSDADHIIHLPQTARRRKQNGGRQPGLSVRFGCLLVVLFSSLMLLEFMAYRMLGISTTPADSTASTATSNDGAAQRIDAATAQHAANDGMKDNSSPKLNPQTPTKHPTNKPVLQMSYEPTARGQAWRLKAARMQSNENSDFWKTHTPDPVPPLPPNIDPGTGEELPPVIAYVTTLTKCGPKHRGGLDGAAVLLHSIRRNSYGWLPIREQIDKANNPQISNDESTRPQYGGHGGRYRYRAYVIVDPMASPDNPNRSGECARFLKKIGYTILHRPPLVPLFQIKDKNATEGVANDVNDVFRELKEQGYVGIQRPPSAMRPRENPDKLRMFMHNDGCCGYTELLKLHVYGLVEHKLAVHLDFDSLLLRPMDDLFDAMLGKGDETTRNKLPLAKLPRTKEVDLTKPIDAAFTRDYNSVIFPRPDSPVGYQGGFLVVRPNLEVLERYRTILKRAEFLIGPRDGWAGKFGGFYGDVTFQGILPYYYEDVAPKGEHNEVELDRCIYNQMADNPRKSSYRFPRATPLDAKKMGFHDTDQCRDGRTDCSDTDCQRIHPKDSITTHFTFCKKPWDCSEGLKGTVASDTCLGLLREWYGVRRELEDWWLLPPIDSTAAQSDNLNNQQGFYWKDKTIANVRKSWKGTSDAAQYFGYCDALETDGYHRLIEPDGPKS